MELKKDGVLYKVAYGYSEHPPTKTNLCQFFWRVVLSFFFVWPAAILLLGLIYGVGSPFALVFGGCRPTSLNDPKGPFKPISWWPKFRDGANITPSQILGRISKSDVTFGSFLTVIVLLILWVIGWILYDRGILLHVLGAIVALVALVVACLAIRKREGWKMVKEYIKAKKQKVCPLISFVDNPKD